MLFLELLVLPRAVASAATRAVGDAVDPGAIIGDADIGAIVGNAVVGDAIASDAVGNIVVSDNAVVSIVRAGVDRPVASDVSMPAGKVGASC